MSDKPDPKTAKGAKGAKTAIAKADGADVDKADGEDKPTSRLSWVVGWVLVPATVIGVIFGGGALVGAHFHDSWFTRAIVWVVELFV